jgi:hypothetical protein
MHPDAVASYLIPPSHTQKNRKMDDKEGGLNELYPFSDSCCMLFEWVASSAGDGS